MSFSPTVSSVFPSLVTGDDRLFLAWQEDEAGGSAIFLAMNAGGAWSAPARLSPAGAWAIEPSLVRSPVGDVHLGWSGDDEVRHRRWDAGTKTWGPAEMVAHNQVGASGVRFSAKDDLHAVWLAFSRNGMLDVYYGRAWREPPVMTHLPMLCRH